MCGKLTLLALSRVCYSSRRPGSVSSTHTRWFTQSATPVPGDPTPSGLLMHLQAREAHEDMQACAHTRTHY